MAHRVLRLSLFGASLVVSCNTVASETEDSVRAEIMEDQPVITVTAPELSPLTVVNNLTTTRQPVPASDGSDYLKTIPGFSQIRNGGTNGDPVFRGMFGSRLRILTNNSELLGACPARMDAPRQ